MIAQELYISNPSYPVEIPTVIPSRTPTAGGVKLLFLTIQEICGSDAFLSDVMMTTGVVMHW